MNRKLTILKLGGELLEDAGAMHAAARGVASLLAGGPVAVVHGGGRAIDADLRARGKAPRFVDGLRVTDADTLDTVVGVLAGQVNTSFVAALVAAGVQAVGLTGADAGLGRSVTAPPLQTTAGTSVDLGRVGVPEPAAPATVITDLISLGYVPVIASIGMTNDGELLNVNADVLAAHLAKATDASRLIIGGRTAGVFDEAGQTCARLDESTARRMVASGTAKDGMVAKLGACLDAIAGGVAEVRIVDGRAGEYLQAAGTLLCRGSGGQAVLC